MTSHTVLKLGLVLDYCTLLSALSLLRYPTARTLTILYFLSRGSRRPRAIMSRLILSFITLTYVALVAHIAHGQEIDPAAELGPHFVP